MKIYYHLKINYIELFRIDIFSVRYFVLGKMKLLL